MLNSLKEAWLITKIETKRQKTNIKFLKKYRPTVITAAYTEHLQ